MGKTSFDEVLDYAIRKEQEAVDGYTMASKMVKRSNVREMLLDMAKQEEGHRIKLEHIDRTKVASAEIRNVLDLKIADQTDTVEIAPAMDYQDLLTVAMKREEKAHNLYMTLASNTDDPELQKLFKVLAQEEAKHKLALEKEYDDHVLTEN